MAFLSTNRYRDSWAYRSQNGGFNRCPTRNDGDPDAGGFRPQSASASGTGTGGRGGLNQSATTDTMQTLNKTMSQLQFNSRPNTPTNTRNFRPASAGAMRGTKLNQNPNNRRTANPQTHLKADLTDPNNLNDVQYFDEIAGNRYKESWAVRNGEQGDMDVNNRENSAGNRQSRTMKIDPSTVTLNPKSSVPTPLSKVPRYVETDKQVLRFFCHFFDKETQITHHPDLLKVKHPSTARLFTLLVYLNDFTVEIAEDKQMNSGYRGGQFYKRNYLKKDDGTEITVQDLKVGGTLTLLGHDFFITDCDSFTRGYFRYVYFCQTYRQFISVNNVFFTIRRTYEVILADPEPRPDVKNPDIGAQNSTGLGMTDRQIASGQSLKKKAQGTRSQNYLEKREQIDKTSKFLNYSGVILNFK
jgi:hypothetical protein